MEDAGDDTAWLALGYTAEQVLGKRVAEHRRARGWSQDELARRMVDAGFSWRQTTVAKTEKADRPVRLNEAIELARLFRTDVDHLVDPDRRPLVSRLAKAKQELYAAEQDAARAQAEAKGKAVALEMAADRIAALEAVIMFWRGPQTVATLSRAVEAVLHPIIAANPWEALLVEAGVPRDVVRAAKQYGLDWTDWEDRRAHETGEEQAKRRITTYLVRWFESSGGECGGEHSEAS